MADITKADYDKAASDVRWRTDQISSLQSRIDKSQQELEQARASVLAGNQADEVRVSNLERSINRDLENVSSAKKALETAQSTVTAFESQPTVPPKSESETKEKYEKSEVVAASTTDQESAPPAAPEPPDAPDTSRTDEETGRSKQVPAGAIPPTPKPASVNFKSMAGDDINQDMRVKIRVPQSYLTQLTQGPSNELKNLKGIIFPYTPSISIEHKADYTAQAPLHSNYAVYFYQRSSVSPINISGKFTVSNENEAGVYLATIHLLRALTKMRSGGPTGDADSGAPPPICRLDAYGTFMLQNVPVVISSFKIDLPDNVDYYTLGKNTNSESHATYEMTSVPIVSTISVTCTPMYSRDEMQKFNVTQWLGEKYVRKAGYL